MDASMGQVKQQKVDSETIEENKNLKLSIAMIEMDNRRILL
ncbi:MAG: hypothetical protein RID25_23320 [Cyclobacteriaceae bacterium]